MNGRRNSRWILWSLNCRLLSMPLLSRLPSTSLPPFHSSALVPSNRTTAPCGGFSPSVLLLRKTLPSLNSPPSSLLPLSTTPSAAISPLHPLPVISVLPASVLAAALCLVLPSQPSPDRPPGRKLTVNFPSPWATTWAPSLSSLPV